MQSNKEGTERGFEGCMIQPFRYENVLPRLHSNNRWRSGVAYALGSIEGKAAEGTPAEASGAWWMNHGIEVALRGDFQGAAFRLDSK